MPEVAHYRPLRKIRGPIHTAVAYKPGHAGRLADLIAARALDEALKQDPHSRIDCRVTLDQNRVTIGGEWTTKADVDLEAVVRSCIEDAGYKNRKWHPKFNGINFKLENRIKEQSSDLRKVTGGAGTSTRLRSDDLVRVTGYATLETLQRLPLASVLARELMSALMPPRFPSSSVRPDGKAMVTLEYDWDLEPVRLHTLVVNCNHTTRKDLEGKIRPRIFNDVISKIVSSHFRRDDSKILVNPGGPFIEGGPLYEVGTSGSLAHFDTYDEFVPSPTTGLAGVDPTKIFLTGTLMARYMAINLLGAAHATLDTVRNVMVEMSFLSGQTKPDYLRVVTNRDERFLHNEAFQNALITVFGKMLDPQAMIEALSLRTPRYYDLAKHGYFGRASLPWEGTDKVANLFAII